MTGDVDLSAVGALLAEPARCRILLALIDGRALPASALALEAHVAPSTASAHLARLVDAEWLAVEQHGRHRYYRLGRADVAEVLEATARLAPPEPVRSLRGDTRRRQLRRARTCYGHLAGRLGVALLDRMLDRGWVRGHDGSFRPGNERLSAGSPDLVYVVTAGGSAGLAQLGVHVDPGSGSRHCVDWSEQRHHLAGTLGARLAERLFDLGWLARAERGRVVTVTRDGWRGLREAFGIDPDALET